MKELKLVEDREEISLKICCYLCHLSKQLKSRGFTRTKNKLEIISD